MSVPVDSHDHYEHEILTQIQTGNSVSQRSLSNQLGIALGLTNLLVRRLIRKGWIRVIQVRPNRVLYFLTPAGAVEKARLSRDALQDSIHFYTSARKRIRESLSRVGGSATRIVFFGTGDVAEIAYVCLQETDLDLVGVVGEAKAPLFFGRKVYSADQVADGKVGDQPYDCLVVTVFQDQDAVREQLASLGVSSERVHWL